MAEPKSGVEALQAAVIDGLRASAPLTALVGARIYDEVPADSDRPQPPYVYVGGVSKARRELSCGPGWNIRLRLYVVGLGFGRLALWEIVEIIAELVDETEPVLAGRWALLDRITVASAADVVEPADPKSAAIELVTILSD